MSRKDVTSEYHQRLIIVQEEKILIHQINRLTDCGIPPTVRMVRNLVEEVINELLAKNWISHFGWET